MSGRPEAKHRAQLDLLPQLTSNERREMPNPPKFTRSLWFVTLLALVVALGAQVLIEALTPLATFDWLLDTPRREPIVLIAGVTSFWREDSIIRALSFGIGALVACLFASTRSWQLTASLVAVSLVASAFAQFPRPATLGQLAIWGSAGPGAALLVCAIFQARRRDA